MGTNEREEGGKVELDARIEISVRIGAHPRDPGWATLNINGSARGGWKQPPFLSGSPDTFLTWNSLQGNFSSRSIDKFLTPFPAPLSPSSPLPQL